jgi:hypothetical protein
MPTTIDRRTDARHTELAAREPEPAAPARFSFPEMEQIAAQVAKSGLFKGIDSPQKALCLMLLCESEGLHPMQAMRRYHIIEGQPSMRADAMQAEFQRQGGRIDWGDTDAKVCEATFSHPVHCPKGKAIRVTLDELIDNGTAMSWDKESRRMVLKTVYKRNPASMLRARVISQGVRLVAPGVVVGIYTPEEVSDFEEVTALSAPALPPYEPGLSRSANLARRLASPEAPEAAPEPEENRSPAQGPPPRSGRALFAWCKDIEQRLEVGILKYVNNWGKMQEFPGRMVDWDADQTALAYAEACRKLRATPPHPEPVIKGDDAPDRSGINKEFPAKGHKSRRDPRVRWDQWLNKLLERWHEAEPMTKRGDQTAREHRIAHTLVTEAIAQGLITEESVCKPAEAGKPLVRDPRRVWEQVHTLVDVDFEWVKATTTEYLKEKIVAAAETMEQSVDDDLPQPIEGTREREAGED